MIRIGLIGCGGIANAHVNAYLHNKDRFRIQALADVSKEAAESLKARFGLEAQIYNDYRELLKREDIDAVDIMLPHNLHKVAILDSLNAGKHVIVEKPLCITPSEVEEVAEALKGTNLKLFPGHNQVFTPGVQEAKRMADEGYLGRVFFIRTQDCFPTRIKGWRLRKSEMGGGELIDTGYHPTYLMNYLSGGRISTVYALSGKFLNREMEGEDTAFLALKLEDGGIGNIHTSWAHEIPSQGHTYTLIGERGQLYGGLSSLHFKVPGMSEAKREWPVIRDPYADSFINEMRHFADVLEGKAKQIQTVEDAERVIRVIAAAYKSIETGRPVGLNEV